MAGSTDIRARLGEVSADQFFRDHEQLLRPVVDERAGTVLKGAGDGVMAVFNAASDAIAAAIAIQQRVADDPSHISVRIGVSAGDVSWENGDCFGMPVVIASRLEHACEPGGILVAAIVRHLAGDRVDAAYRSVEPLDLKGVPEPVEAFDVAWAPVREHAPTWRFASALPRRSTLPFVGRQRELDLLDDLFADIESVENRIALIVGEAGAGKTRLATEFALRCHERRAIVICGLCDRELSLPYQPWVMALTELIDQFSPTVVESARLELGQLRAIVPQVDRMVPGLSAPERLDPETERHRMFTAVADLLTVASTMAPMVVVLEDLHWAGGQTLALLRFLGRNRPVPRCLLVATLRDTDDEISDALAATLAEFRRNEAETRIRVGGIDDGAVEELLRARSVDGDLRERAIEIARRTGGNAFLVSELTRTGAGGPGEVPESVRDVVEQRLAQLRGGARDLARTIAVAGRVEFSVLVESRANEAASTPEALGELLGTGLVQELGDAPPTYHFAHELIREAVDSTLPAHDRLVVHERLALAIERVHETDRRPVLASLTRHFVAAAPSAGWHKAAYYGRRAAAHARRTAAYEEAIELISASLSVTPAPTEERALLLLDAVDLLQRCGRNPEAVLLAEEADDMGCDLDDMGLCARASIEVERAAHLANAMLDRSLPRLQRVLDRSAELDAGLRVRARASLGRARWLAGLSGGPELVAAALEEVRGLADDSALSHVLEMACVTERDPHVALATATELEQVAASLGDVFRSMWAMTRLTDALLTLGRLAEAEVVLGRLSASSARFRFTNYCLLALWFRHTLALAAGVFEASEAAAEAANTEDPEFATIDASGAYGLQMFMIRRAQGRLEEMRPILQLLARDPSGSGMWKPGLVIAYAELGMLDEARSGFDALMVDRCAGVPRDTLWPLTLRFLGEACDVLDRSVEATILLDELESFAGLTLRAGYTTNGGPADRVRAVLSEVAGRSDRADELIASAHRLALASGSPLWLVEVEMSWSRIEARRRDAAGAAMHHERAAAIARPVGIGSVQDVPPGGPTALTKPAGAVYPDGLSQREVEVLHELAHGRTNRQIAEKLFISPNTAANHVRSILQKTGMANRTEAAARAFQLGLVDPNGQSAGAS